MLKQIEEDSREKTKGSVQGWVNVSRLTDGHISGDTSFNSIPLGSGQ